jgi:hypothetical protein
LLFRLYVLNSISNGAHPFLSISSKTCLKTCNNHDSKFVYILFLKKTRFYVPICALRILKKVNYLVLVLWFKVIIFILFCLKLTGLPLICFYTRRVLKKSDICGVPALSIELTWPLNRGTKPRSIPLFDEVGRLACSKVGMSACPEVSVCLAVVVLDFSDRFVFNSDCVRNIW